MKKMIFATILMVMALSAVAQVPNDSIVADFNEFVRLLEETHPDPYTNYGGKPFFRKAAMETRFNLIQDSVTSTDELARRMREFLVPLHDGHTGIWTQQNSNNNALAPIMFEAINDAIIIKHLPDEYKELIGSRLLAIENVPVNDVCDGLAKYYTTENNIGKKPKRFWKSSIRNKNKYRRRRLRYFFAFFTLPFSSFSLSSFSSASAVRSSPPLRRGRKRR